jgi:hypothetical protein
VKGNVYYFGDILKLRKWEGAGGVSSTMGETWVEISLLRPSATLTRISLGEENHCVINTGTSYSLKDFQ